MKRMLLASATLLCLLLPDQVFAFAVDGSCTAVSPNEDVKVQWTQLPAHHKSSANPRSLTPGGDLPGNYQVTVTRQSRTLCQGYAEPTSAMRAGITGVFAAVSPEVTLKIALDPSRQGYQATTGSISCENGTTYAYNLDCGVKVMGAGSAQSSPAQPEKKSGETAAETRKPTGQSNDGKALSAKPKSAGPAQEAQKKISNIDDLTRYSSYTKPAEVGEQYEKAIDKICMKAESNGGEVKPEMKGVRTRSEYTSHTQTPFVNFTKIANWSKVEPLEYFYGATICGSKPFLHYLSSIGACFSGLGGLIYLQERVEPEVLRYILTMSMDPKKERDIREDLNSKMGEQDAWCPMYLAELDKILGPKESKAAP